MTDDEFRKEQDRFEVAHAHKPWPDRSRVRRVRVDEPGDPPMQRQLAERLAAQRMEDDT